MKKLLVILMVVAMASFLFTGCIPTVPVAVTGVTLDQATMTLTAGGATGTLVATVAPATATDKSVTWSSSALAVATVANGVVTPLTAGTTTITVTTVDGSLTATCAVTVQTGGVDATVAPIITSITDNATVPVAVISLTSTATQYMNAAEVALGIIVNGTAPTYSEVKVYVDDVCAGTADVGVTGTFSVLVAEADLGADGDKVIYATAEEAALDVSAHSTEYAFVLDQVKPTATTLAATASTADAVDSAQVSGTNPLSALAISTAGNLVAGTWTITCLADSSVNTNVTISDGTTTTYTVNDGDIFVEVIPGVTFTFAAGFDAGDSWTVTVTDAILARATVLFDEEITFASADAATTFVDTTNVVAQTDTFVSYNSKISYYTFSTVLARYSTLRCVVNGATDLAGNIQTTANVLTCAVGAASATSLAP